MIGHKIAFQIHENKYAAIAAGTDIANAIHTVSLVFLCAAKIPFFAKLQAKVITVITYIFDIAYMHECGRECSIIISEN